VGLEDELRERDRRRAEKAARRQEQQRQYEERELRRITEELAELVAIHRRKRVPTVALYTARSWGRFEHLCGGWEISPYRPEVHVPASGHGWEATSVVPAHTEPAVPGLFLGEDGVVRRFRIAGKRIFHGLLDTPSALQELSHERLLRIAERTLAAGETNEHRGQVPTLAQRLDELWRALRGRGPE
jgi:hypothetical protein